MYVVKVKQREGGKKEDKQVFILYLGPEVLDRRGEAKAGGSREICYTNKTLKTSCKIHVALYFKIFSLILYLCNKY